MLNLLHLTFACDDPERLAAFWAELLGYEVRPDGSSESTTASDPSGAGPTLLFGRMPKSPTIEVPIHLDVNVPDREAEVERALALGARLVGTKTHSIGTFAETWTVMHDPEGNGFCVQEPPDTNRGYIGNVTFSCADPPRLAEFWSEALGWPEEDVGEDFLQQLLDAGLDRGELSALAAVRRSDGGRPRFLFQRRQKSPTESIPLHPDFSTEDREAEVERLTRLGASVVETKVRPSGFTFTVMRDPEGNPFCVA